MQQRKWTEYIEHQRHRPPRPILNKALTYFDDRFLGHAVDIGFGSGNEVYDLVRRGWTVTAIDQEQTAIDQMQLLESKYPDKLQIQKSNFEAIKLPKNEFDLVISCFSLPFCQPNCFKSLWQEIEHSLVPGGIFCGQLFGANDSWASNKSMSFHNRQQVEELLSSYSLKGLIEEERDGPSFSEESKHWHLFHFIVQKGRDQ